jgi:hypothetical protein
MPIDGFISCPELMSVLEVALLFVVIGSIDLFDY